MRSESGGSAETCPDRAAPTAAPRAGYFSPCNRLRPFRVGRRGCRGSANRRARSRRRRTCDALFVGWKYRLQETACPKWGGAQRNTTLVAARREAKILLALIADPHPEEPRSGVSK